MKRLVERFALWILHLLGTDIIVVPIYMQRYYGEIKTLCVIEEQLAKGNPSYTGYFKYRRVFTQMLKAHPNLNGRDLSKAINSCSDSIGSGVGAIDQIPTPLDRIQPVG